MAKFEQVKKLKKKNKEVIINKIYGKWAISYYVHSSKKINSSWKELCPNYETKDYDKALKYAKSCMRKH